MLSRPPFFLHVQAKHKTDTPTFQDDKSMCDLLYEHEEPGHSCIITAPQSLIKPLGLFGTSSIFPQIRNNNKNGLRQFLRSYGCKKYYKSLKKKNESDIIESASTDFTLCHGFVACYYLKPNLMESKNRHKARLVHELPL